MKACLISQSVGSHLSHSIATILKEKYGINEFCTYVFMPWAADFVRKQKEINYNPILVDHEIHAKINEEKIDLDYLNYFEETYHPHNNWFYIYLDRKLIASIGLKEGSVLKIDPLYKQDGLIKSFQVRAKAIEKMLKEEKPDFILFFTVGNISQLLLFHIAKKLGIKTLVISFARIGNKICLSEHYNTLTDVEKDFIKFRGDTARSSYHEEAEKIIKQFEETGSLKLNYFEVSKKNIKQNKNKSKIKKWMRSIKYLFTHTANHRRYRDLFLYNNSNQQTLTFIFQKLRQTYRGIVGLSRLYSKPDFNKEYAFYALHYEPELAVQVLSPFYSDQLSIIKYIARSLPIHYKLYVKEHPLMINKRPKRYYKELLKIPNVKLIDQKIDGFEMIKHSKIVATITGTAGWEAALLGKPVITFGNVFYNDLPQVKRIRQIEDLPTTINRQLKEFSPNEKTTIDFVAAILKNSINLDFSSLRAKQNIEEIKKNKGVQRLCDLIIEKMKPNIYP